MDPTQADFFERANHDAFNGSTESEEPSPRPDEDPEPSNDGEKEG